MGNTTKVYKKSGETLENGGSLLFSAWFSDSYH